MHASSRKTDADGRVTVQPIVERLEIGAPIRPGATDRFARLSDRPEAIMDLMELPLQQRFLQPFLMIDPTATGQRPEDVRVIRLEPAVGEALRIECVGSEWKLSSASVAHATTIANVEGLLGKLCDSRASEITLSAAPADLIAGRIIFETLTDHLTTTSASAWIQAELT
jgi:hypothetical protein